MQFVGVATGTTSATIPAHQAGDVIVAFAYRDGNTAAPALGAGFTNISNSTGASTNGSRLAYLIATGSGTSSGTWTNATNLVIMVLRPEPGMTIEIGAASSQTGTATSVTYPALTPVGSFLTSGYTLLAFAGHRSTNVSLGAPSGLTEATQAANATAKVAAHYGLGRTTAWTATSVAAGGTASGWMTRMLAIRETAEVAVTTPGTGSFAFTQAGTLKLRGWGAGGGGAFSGGGGGAYAETTLDVVAGDVLYWSVASAANGAINPSNGDTGANGASSWARINVNSAPTSSAEGVLARGGGGSDNTSGAPGSATTSIGTTKFAGGQGNAGGGGGGGPSGDGGAGGAPGSGSGGTDPGGVGNYQGNNGGTGSELSPGGAGVAPGGGGGGSGGASGGAGARGQINYELTAAAPSGEVFLQTVDIAASSAVNLLRNAGKRVAVSLVDAVTVRRAGDKRVSVAAIGSVSASKAATRTIAVLTEGAVFVRKATAKRVSVLASSITAVNAELGAITNYLKTITINATGAVSLRKAVGKSLAVAGAATVLIAKGIAKRVSVALASAVTIIAGRLYFKTISVGLASSVTVLSNALAFVLGERIVQVVALVRRAIAQAINRSSAAGMESRAVAVLSESRSVIAEPDERDADPGAGDREVQPEN